MLNLKFGRVILLITTLIGLFALSHQKGEGPEMTFQPLPPKISKYIFWSEQPTLIEYMPSHFESVHKWTAKLDSFLEEYKSRESVHNVNCDGQFGKISTKDVCNVDLSTFGPCTQENFYGYDRGTPCVFITFEKKRKWVPDVYNTSNNLPEDMPFKVKEAIKTYEGTNKTNQIWVNCEGETPTDVSNIGPISYYPLPGVSKNFFPYVGQDGYLTALVAIQLERPTHGVTLAIRCKAWAKNIVHDAENNIGTVRFELLLN